MEQNNINEFLYQFGDMVPIIRNTSENNIYIRKTYFTDENVNIIRNIVKSLYDDNIPDILLQRELLNRLSEHDIVLLPTENYITKSTHFQTELKSMKIFSKVLLYLSTHTLTHNYKTMLIVSSNIYQRDTWWNILLTNILSIFSYNINESKIYQLLSQRINPENIYLSNNLLTMLPKTFFYTKTIKRMDLSNNFLIEIPHEISYMKNLIFLNISHNKLTTLPHTINKLTNLVQFFVNHNQLITLPSLIKMKKLNHVLCNNNKLQKIPDLPLLIRKIDLSDNNISSLPTNLYNMYAFCEISMKNNPINVNFISEQDDLSIRDNRTILFTKSTNLPEYNSLKTFSPNFLSEYKRKEFLTNYFSILHNCDTVILNSLAVNYVRNEHSCRNFLEMRAQSLETIKQNDIIDIFADFNCLNDNQQRKLSIFVLITSLTLICYNFDLFLFLIKYIIWYVISIILCKIFKMSYESPFVLIHKRHNHDEFEISSNSSLYKKTINAFRKRIHYFNHHFYDRRSHFMLFIIERQICNIFLIPILWITGIEYESFIVNLCIFLLMQANIIFITRIMKLVVERNVIKSEIKKTCYFCVYNIEHLMKKTILYSLSIYSLSFLCIILISCGAKLLLFCGSYLSSFMY